LHAPRLSTPYGSSSGANALKDEGMTKPDTPFPKHWLYYIVLKYAIIAAAVLIALYVVSQSPSEKIGVMTRRLQQVALA
jgi:hypothetical protein